MKHKFLLSALTAIIVVAATATAEAGIFGRLSVVWNGCNPCEPVACNPCEPIACNPCEPIACNPCEVVACDPCEPVCGDFGYRPFRPFGGFFANLFTPVVLCGPVSCDPCEPVACSPCEPIACNPCEVVACDPCEPICGPFVGRPFRPFGGFFANLFTPVALCGPVSCDPCEPVCDPCAACSW